MAFKGQQLTVTTTPSALVSYTDAGADKFSLLITVGAVDIWVHGFSDVDTSGTKGCIFKAGGVYPITLDPGEEIYARTASSSSICNIAFQGVD